ncbi:MAG: branched-chain amino acid ABC transporter permease [Thermodesulfobacteriota bacterium]
MTSSYFLQMLLNGLQLAAVYILISLGFTLIFGILHIVNIAHASIYMLGGYAIWLFCAVLGLNYYLSILLTIIVVALIGVGIELSIFRPLKGQVMPAIIASTGLMLVIEHSALIGFGLNEKVITAPFPGVLRFWGTVFPIQRLAIMGIGILLTAALVVWVQRSKVGLALRAVALDKDAAAMYGIGYNRYGMLAFALGSGLAGAAGGLVAPLYYVNPYMGHQPLLKMFIVVIVGGLGSIKGTILAGLMLGMIDSFVATLFDSVLAAIVGFAMIIVVLVIKPTGFAGHE